MRGSPFRSPLSLPAIVLSLVLPAGAAGATGPFSIAIIGKGSAEPSWQDVVRGATMAAQERGVTISCDGPEDGSADAQVALLSSALERRPSAICIDALDSHKIVPLVQKARAEGIPVIGFDSGVDSPLVVCTAATDNVPAAALAATKLAALLGSAGKVGVVLSAPDDPVASAREKGFADEMRRRHPGIRIVGPRYAGADPARAAEAATAMLGSDPDIAGFFAGDEACAAGILKAVKGRPESIVVVGMDSGQAQIDAIRAGVEAGAVTQDPIRIGYKAVEAAVDALRGRRLPRRIDTGFHWYDRASIEDPALAVLLHP